MVRKKKLSAAQKMKLAMLNKVFDMADAFVKGAGAPRKKATSGHLAGGVAPAPCGKCD